MISSTESGYDRFNARMAPPADVARDFVMPISYSQLIDTVEAQLLIGPRGIGKTTLLKMLMPQALDAWNSREGRIARKRVGFTGVFLQADKIWAGQFDRMSGSLSPLAGANDYDALRARFAHRSRFGRAAFTYMAFAAFADTAGYRCRPAGNKSAFRWVKISRGDEERLISRIASSWQAHPATSSFKGLAEQMRSNLSRIGQLMVEAGGPHLSKDELGRILTHHLLNIDFRTAASEFIGLFNRCVNEEYAPWILLIDEFEFLPPTARFQIGEAFQGGDPRLSYKVSLAPYTGIAPFAGSEMHDWHKLVLTHGPTDDFSRRLLTRELHEIGSPGKILKGRGFAGPRKDTFGKGSRNANEVRRLAEIDDSFRSWLEKTMRGASLDVIKSGEPRYRQLHKAMPLVRLRLRHQEGGRVSEFYAGVNNAYLLTEGNPRWIKALAYELQRRHQEGTDISEARQAEAITQVARVLYENIRVATIQQRSGQESAEASTDVSPASIEYVLTPYSALKELAGYLRRQTHEEPFRGDVPAVFVSENNGEWLDDVLNSLIFLGALVVEPHEEGRTDERLRLAHIWAPLFELLMSKGPQQLLTDALQPTALAKPSALRRQQPSRGGDTTGGMRALVSDETRRVSIRSWKSRTLAELATHERYDGVVASVGYEPRSFAIGEALGPISDCKVAIEFSEQQTDSYARSLERFNDAGFEVRQDWDGLFVPFISGWLGEFAKLDRPAHVAIDISSMNRKRIAAVVEVLAGLQPSMGLTTELLYAPAQFNPPTALPEEVATLAPVSAYFAGELLANASTVGLVGVGYEPSKAPGALANLEIACAGVYVPKSSDKRVMLAVLGANRGLLDTADQHEPIEYEILDPFDCIMRLQGRSRALLQMNISPVIIPLGPKVFALSSCIAAASHYPAVQVWRASFDFLEDPMERVADGDVCGVTIHLAPTVRRDGRP